MTLLDATPPAGAPSAPSAPAAAAAPVAPPTAAPPGVLARGLGAVRRAVRPITSLGWTLVVVGLVAWYAGVRLQWEELLILAGACLVALTIAVALTVGRLALDISVAVRPERVEVGEEAIAVVRVRNPRGRPSLGARIEVPVGAVVHPVEIGALGAGQEAEDQWIVPTRRRAVIAMGPARSVKGDPLGIARREVESGEEVVLHVHPRTILVPRITAGWMRDLEGETTNDLSTSDVAFHTLREYVPGDDRRHIHWRTSARLGTLMVRQFVDTRRSHLGIVLSVDESDWADPDEFELGVSVVGSLGRTTLIADQELTVTTGTSRLPSHSPDGLLDALSAVEREPSGLALHELVHRSSRHASAASVVVVVVGSTVAPNVIRAACARFRPEVEVFAIRCVPGEVAGRRRSGAVSMLDVGRLDDLARIFAVLGGR